MSDTLSQTNMEARLNALQCHFTWDELTNNIKPWVVRDDLEKIGTHEGNCWLPHIYNLQGCLHHHLGSDEKAFEFLNRATEDFHRHDTEEGPWLMVNYGNLAWLQHLRGQQSESERYLSLAEGLMRRHPGVTQDELHPEVAAEKAWTLMTLYTNHLKKAEVLFLAAIEREPERVEWKTSLVLALLKAQKHESSLKEETWQRLQRAKEEDPENLYIAVKHLRYRAKRGEDVADEARKFAEQVLKNPVSSYSGLKQLLRVYHLFLPTDEAVELAEDALRQHPDERFLKSCAALCYYWKITYCTDGSITPTMMNRGISLHQEVIALYPDTCLVKEINLVDIYACTDVEKAAEKYQELLARDLDSENKQILFNHYARYLCFRCRNYNKSIDYNMKAAEIQMPGFHRNHSINYLEMCIERHHHRAVEIQEFLRNLPGDEP